MNVLGELTGEEGTEGGVAVAEPGEEWEFQLNAPTDAVASLVLGDLLLCEFAPAGSLLVLHRALGLVGKGPVAESLEIKRKAKWGRFVIAGQVVQLDGPILVRVRLVAVT